MILLKILEHDLHRSRKAGATPLMIEIPARSEFMPALVSNARGEFLTSRRLTSSKHIRVGVFSYDSDRVDDVVLSMMDAAYELSREEGWENIIEGRGPARVAFDYIRKQALAQPHICLVPHAWKAGTVNKFFGPKNISGGGRKYRKYCRIVSAKVVMPVFLSRPDMVGMYTQFMGGKTSILLHNIKLGMAFCPPKGGS